MAVSFVTSSRGTFSAGAKTLSFATPATAVKGDTLLAVISHNLSDSYNVVPSGWTAIDSVGSGADALDVFARMVDGTEASATAFSLFTVANEWQGELVALRGTAPGAFKEARASTSFAATTALATAGVMVQQAIDLIVTAWTCSGSPTLTLPAGFTAIDSFSTALVGARSMLVGYRLAGASDMLTFPNATASAATTGRSFTFAVRDRPPLQPVALVDPVPGNIGLIGKDTRPAR